MMRRPDRMLLRFLAGIGLLLAAGCGVSEKMVQLPPARGLAPLGQLENHLNYTDPYEGRADYKPVGGGGR